MGKAIKMTSLMTIKRGKIKEEASELPEWAKNFRLIFIQTSAGRIVSIEKTTESIKRASLIKGTLNNTPISCLYKMKQIILTLK